MIKQTVLLYGKSLLLSGIAVSLTRVPGLKVILTRTWGEASRMLEERMPDVLIFELRGHSEGHIMSLLLANPHPAMVGLDTECNQAVLLPGRAARSLTLDQLTSFLDEQFALNVAESTVMPGT